VSRRVIIGIASLLWALRPGATAQPPPPPDSLYYIRDSVLIPTRDGHSIWSIIVLKKAFARPLPAILFFTTYYEGTGDSYFGKISADREYAGVVAYSRGIRTNIDDYAPYEHDGNDAYDVIDWISRQSWCDGRVGMFGGSYTGFVQWSAAKRIHPALKTIVPQVAVMPGFDTPMENNVPQGFTLSWPNGILNYKPLPGDLNQTWYARGSSYRTLDSLAGHPNRIFQKWLRHPSYDTYWKSLVPTPAEYANITIPVLCTTGYYDGAQIGAMEYAREYLKYRKNPELYFVIGPYDHWGGQRNAPADTLMGYPIDTAAKRSMRWLAFDWFDYVLKGKPKPELLKDRINYEVMGAGEWRHAPSFGAMSNDTLTFYLRADKEGDRSFLAPQRAWKREYLTQIVDFKDRTTENNYYTPVIINDSLSESNGIVFESEPFTEPLILNGCFFGAISASINKKDMDFSIAYYEEMPDGRYFYLTRYLGRASYARDNEARELLAPNKVTLIPMRETRMVCRKFEKGSKLLAVLNVDKHPFEEINYGTGKDVHDESIRDAGEPLQVRWYNDSFIKVPIWRDSE
jgi:putative CocE/NonD family hydrolase